MILVLGGGFGLYGHLGALAGLGRPVLTLERYRDSLLARPELRHLVPQLSWCKDEAAGMAAASTVVLARRPVDNEALATQLVASGWRGQLVVEKPVGADAAAGARLTALLNARGLPWAVPYTFLYCDWAEALARALASPSGARARVRWQFRQGASVREWKRTAAEGGGALAFYFIHFLAVAQALLPEGTHQLQHRAEGARTHCELVTTQGASELTLAFTLGDEVGFAVDLGGASLVQRSTPFSATPAFGEPDPRIAPLQAFYERAVFGTHIQSSSFHQGVNRLWADFEALEQHPS